MHDSPLVRSLVSGLTAFRVACLVWLVAILAATRNEVDRPSVGFVLVGAATVVTVPARPTTVGADVMPGISRAMSSSHAVVTEMQACNSSG